ncbi:MAG: hypothetical protein ACO1O6_06525 [Bacteroidota bacterium]
MARIKSFETPHKGLRNVIGKFAYKLGYTEFSDQLQLQQLKQLGNELFLLLNDHVHTENEHTLAHLEARMKGASDHDKADHEKLEVIQDSLQQRLNAFTGLDSTDDMHQFYLDFSLFQSQYLEHIFEEETVTELLLQQHFTDEELIQHRNSIMQRIPFPTLLLWLKYIIPAQREENNIALLSGLRANAPEEAFQSVLETIRSEMDSKRYHELVLKLE